MSNVEKNNLNFTIQTTTWKKTRENLPRNKNLSYIFAVFWI
jgi:hypothetical protein